MFSLSQIACMFAKTPMDRISHGRDALVTHPIGISYDAARCDRSDRGGSSSAAVASSSAAAVASSSAAAVINPVAAAVWGG
jgi:hypothetical protein